MVDKKKTKLDYHPVKVICPSQDFVGCSSRFLVSEDEATNEHKYSTEDNTSYERTNKSEDIHLSSPGNSEQSSQKRHKSTSNENSISIQNSPPHKITFQSDHRTLEEDEPCMSKGRVEPELASRCCITMKEKVIMKRKLNEEDKPSDFALVDGVIYIRKSAVDACAATKGTPKFEHGSIPGPKSEPTEQKSLGADPESTSVDSPALKIDKFEQPARPDDIADEYKAVQADIKECATCCKTLKCGLKDLLRMCHSEPDAVIKLYNDRQGHCGVPDEESGEAFIFQMEKTHGTVFGDEKYHYLMVDKSTLLNEAIPDVPEPKDVKSVNKKSARLADEVTSRDQKRSNIPIFSEVLIQTEPQLKAPSDFHLPTRHSQESGMDSQKQSDNTLVLKQPSRDTTRESDPMDLQKEGVSDRTITTKTESEPISLAEMLEPHGHSRRISIIWDDAIDPATKMVKLASSNHQERRVSAISWSGVDTIRNVPREKESDSQGSPSSSSDFQKATRKGMTQNSFFENIVKEERKKNEEAVNRPRGRSLVSPTERAPSKKKWFGLLKSRKQSDSSNDGAPKQGAIRRRSVIESVNRDADEVDSAYLIKDLSHEEQSISSQNSPRNSLEAYRRRSVPLGRPVFEKKREINQYLHNV
nr:uncharacterized protein LOC111509712 isoform X2 [Leptinotarsa decemlineata]